MVEPPADRHWHREGGLAPPRALGTARMVSPGLLAQRLEAGCSNASVARDSEAGSHGALAASDPAECLLRSSMRLASSQFKLACTARWSAPVQPLPLSRAILVGSGGAGPGPQGLGEFQVNFV